MDFPHPSEINVKRRRIFVAVAIFFVLAGFLVYLCWPDEPFYHGRSLGAWLQDRANPFGDVSKIRDFRSFSSFNFKERFEESQTAVLAIGTNGIPTLLKYLQTRDSAPRSFFASLARRTPILRSRPWTEEDRYLAAEAGFVILQKNALPATPALWELTKNKDPKIRLRAANCLETILLPDVKPLVPIYVAFGHDPDLVNRAEAAIHLRMIGNFLTDDEAEKAGIFRAFPEFRTHHSDKPDPSGSN